MAESGFPGIGTMHWHGLFTTDGTPDEIVRRLHRAVVEALSSEEVKATLENTGARVIPSSSPEQFATEIASEMAQWEKVINEIKLVVD